MPKAYREAGLQLRRLREGSGLSMRQVFAMSKRVAAEKRSRDFLVSSSVLSLIERRGLVPNIFRLYTLSRVYKVSIRRLLALFKIRT